MVCYGFFIFLQFLIELLFLPSGMVIVRSEVIIALALPHLAIFWVGWSGWKGIKVRVAILVLSLLYI
jgi:hypothetical protein